MYTPNIQDINDLATAHDLPIPINNFAAFDNWYSLLHELTHWFVKPLWYQEYALKLKERLQPLEFAPWIPSMQMPNDPTLDEHGARAFGMVLLREKQWTNPVKADPGKFAGSGGFNAYHWISCDTRSLPRVLEQWGIDIAKGIYRPADDGFKLPTQETTVNGLLENWQAIDERYGAGAMVISDDLLWYVRSQFDR